MWIRGRDISRRGLGVLGCSLAMACSGDAPGSVDAIDTAVAGDTDSAEGTPGDARAGDADVRDADAEALETGDTAGAETNTGDAAPDDPGDVAADAVDTEAVDTEDAAIDPVCGDGRLDGEEECDDGNTDAGDGCSPSCVTEDMRVTDADGDTISDFHEGEGDSDEDGVNNALDLDSDGDGHSDAEEAGDADLSTAPVDTDSDGYPDFLDRDSDGDGLSDRHEAGCASGSTDRDAFDSDGDGWVDLVEVFVGTDPCSETSADEFLEFTDALLVIGDGEDLPALIGVVAQVRRADVHIALDQSSSMGGEFANLRSTFSSLIAPHIAEQIPDTAFGISTFDDFLCEGHGADGDGPFVLRQRVTMNVIAAQAALSVLPLRGGGDSDIAQSGYESMFQVATGRGVAGCGVGLPPFDPRVGSGEGEIGGVGYREGALPVLVHVTNAPPHDQADYGDFAASRLDAIEALDSIGVGLIGIASGPPARSSLVDVAGETGSTVPLCAWDDGRPSECAADECCTGESGVGRDPDADGRCPLVFDIDGAGSGLGSAVASGVRALVGSREMQITAVVGGDEEELAGTGIDTSCLIRSVRAHSAVVGDGPCASDPTRVDLDGDGDDDAFAQVTPGTELQFEVWPYGGCFGVVDEPLVFTVFVDFYADGVAFVATRSIIVLILPA